MDPDPHPPGDGTVFLRTLCQGAGLDEAVAAYVRCRPRGETYRVRALVHSLLRRPSTAAAGSLGAGMLAAQMNLPDLACTRFSAVPREVWRRFAADEFFRAAFAADPATARREAAAAVADRPAEVDPRTWVALVRHCLAADGPLAGRVYGVCEDLAAAEPARWAPVTADLRRLARWIDHIRAPRPPRRPTGVPFGVLDHGSFDRARGAGTLDEHLVTLAGLVHVVRQDGVRLDGTDGLDGVAATLRGRVRAPHRVTGTGQVTLLPVGRETAAYEPVPDGTWVLATGDVGGVGTGPPFPPTVAPIYVSCHIDRRALTPRVLEHLRRHGPVGCRDWTTVDLLSSCAVPAFFSGCLTATLGLLAPAGDDARHDEPPADDAAAERPLAELLTAALTLFDTVTRTPAPTARLERYLAARAAGVPARLTTSPQVDFRRNGMAELTDEARERVATALSELLRPVVAAIVAGRPKPEVYDLWRRLCAPRVAADRARRRAVPPMPPPSFDVAATCALIRAQQVVAAPALRPGPAAPVHMAIAYDAKLARQSLVVLEALAANCSRPLHVWALTRGRTRDDHAAVAALFPELAFTFLAFDTVDYGPVAGMLPHTTVSAFDRLLLPELVPELDRILYQDIDALAVGDVAELADYDLAGAPLAACDSAGPTARSGLINAYSPAAKLIDRPDLAYELVRRVHARHRFDFAGFNSGLLVLDLARLRRDRFCAEFLPYVDRYGMPDQQVLNCYAGADRARLPGVWNARPTREVVTAPKLVHWTGAHKPWNDEYVLLKEVWAGYAAAVARRSAGHRAPAGR